MPGQPDRRPLLAGDDNTLRVHSCHGRARQVEVVREAVLHLLAADPSLEPRDVIVMCPDIELFAPLVNAAFGPAALAGAPELRALAHRSLRQTNPLSALAAHLLELAGGRVTAAQVVDLISREPVCRRFGFDEDDLSQIERWLAATGVRWGLDGDHRQAWHLDGLEAGTWRAGLDRLLLGVAMAGHGDLFGGVLPYGDLSSSEISLAGRFAEFIERLKSALDGLAGPVTPSGWAGPWWRRRCRWRKRRPGRPGRTRSSATLCRIWGTSRPELRKRRRSCWTCLKHAPFWPTG